MCLRKEANDDRGPLLAWGRDRSYLRGVVPLVWPDLAHPLIADDGGQPVREGDVLHPELESVAEGLANQRYCLATSRQAQPASGTKIPLTHLPPYIFSRSVLFLVESISVLQSKSPFQRVRCRWLGRPAELGRTAGRRRLRRGRQDGRRGNGRRRVRGRPWRQGPRCRRARGAVLKPDQGRPVVLGSSSIENAAKTNQSQRNTLVL